MAIATRQILSAEDLGLEHPVAVTFQEAQSVNDTAQLVTFEKELKEIAREFEKPIILNFSGVTDVDPRIFLMLSNLQGSYTIRLCHLSDGLKAILQKCDLRNALRILENVAAAEATITMKK